MVDSSTTSWPLWTTWPSAWLAEISGVRSGSRLGVSGVGTQIRTASVRASGAKWLETSMLGSAARSRSELMSSM